MDWLKRTLSSSLGGKYVVALTGLALIGFLVAHLAGNLLIFAGPAALSAYAKGLRDFPVILWTMRLGLLGAFVLHVAVALRLNLLNRAARPVPYAAKTFAKASIPSRTMVYTGLLLLAYLLFHLAHFTFRVTSAEIGAFGPFDVYDMAVASFREPLVSGTYIAAMVVLGFHLTHGASSLTQTLGVNHPKYNRCLRCVGPALGVALPALYISIPVAVLLGLVK